MRCLNLKKGKTNSGAKPLSAVKYFRRNFRKSAAMVLALMLSVFLIYAFKMIVYSVNEATMRGDVAGVEDMTYVIAGTSGSIAPDVLAYIANDPDVERAVPILNQHTQYNHFMGTAEVLVSFLKSGDIPYVMQRKGLTLAAGRLPEPGSNEIVLSANLANNKGKKIGDFIGKEVDPSDILQGKLKIVGLLDGDAIAGLSAMADDQAAKLTNLLVFPKAGKLAGFNAWVESLPPDKAQYWDLRLAEKNYVDSSKTLNTVFSILSIAIVAVMAFAAGNSSYASYFSRRYEFGVLQSVGYTKAQILLRAAKEIGIVSLMGLVFGLALSLGAGAALGWAFFAPHGYIFRLMQPEGLLAALAVPFATALLGLIPAGWMLAKVGPMTAVEKFE